MLKSQLNDSPDKMLKRMTISDRLDTILPIARYVTYAAMFAALLCIVSGLSCEIGSLIDVMEHPHLHGKAVLGAAIMYPIAILGLGLSYLIPFVIAYLYHAIDVSLNTLKPEYQVSGGMTSFLIWGWVILGIFGILPEFIDFGDLEILPVLFILFFIGFLVVSFIWVHRLSKRWSALSPAHKKMADLLRIYTYLALPLDFLGGAIGYTTGDVICNLIVPCVNLYLFYKFDDCFHNISMAYVEAVEQTDNSEDNTQEITNRQ